MRSRSQSRARYVYAALILFFLGTVQAAPLSAQGSLSVSGQSTGSQRPDSTQVGFFRLLESGSDAFLEQFKQETETPSVDEPRWNSQKSPRHTVMTFLEAMDHVALGREKAWPLAIATLGDVEIDDPRAAAMDLLKVFDRLPRITAGTVPGPDMVASQDIQRWELFPRGIERKWAYDKLEEAPEGSITLEKTQDGKWVFSESTVTGASDLLESMRALPPRPRIRQTGELFKSVFEPTIAQTTWADIGWFVGWTLAGVLVAWLAMRLLRILLRWRQDKQRDLLTPLVNGAIMPTWILSITIAMAIGTARLHFHPTLATIRSRIIEASVVLAAIWLLVALLELLCLGVRRSFFKDEDPYARMVSAMVRRALRVVAGMIVAIFLFQNVFHWNVTALLGGFAIVALVLSLAAQDAVKNLFGAFTIFATRPFMVGDWIRFQDKIGTVEDVSLQATRLRLCSGELFSVPNMKFIDSSVKNYSDRSHLRRTMNVRITYDTPPDKVRKGIEILKEVLQSEEVIEHGQADLENFPPRVWFDQFGSHYLNLKAYYWYVLKTEEGQIQRDTERGWFTFLDHASLINEKVLRRFNEAGIDFAFPTQTLYLTNDPDRKLAIEHEEDFATAS